MNPFRQATSRSVGAWLGWAVGVIGWAWVLFANAPQIYPELPTHQTFKIVFPAGIKARTEPIVTTGFPGAGDFLAVRFLDADHAIFVYDVWGVGGPVSPAFATEPGKTRTLDLEMPTLATVRDFKSHEKRPLRIALDGQEIFNAGVYFHRRAAAEIFFAENPIGGSVAEGDFSGQLTTPEGQVLHGRPAPLLNPSAQLRRLVTQRPVFVLATLLASIAAGFGTRASTRWVASRPPRTVRPPTFHGHLRAPHGWAAATVILCGIAFGTLVTGGTFRFTFEESFGSFYDYQAASLLQGRLDVPGVALSGEAFVFEGKIYGYFGPTPALMRLPFAVFHGYVGRLSRIYLLVDYLACLIAVYAIFVHAARRLSGGATWPARGDVVLLLATAGLGCTYFFVGSRAYIYHEAILCGAAFALWSTYCSLRWLVAPASRWWIGALACGTLAVHARPPVGLFALTMLGCAAAVLLWQKRAGGPRAWLRPVTIGLLSVLGVLSFNALSYLKFKSFDGAPLKYHVQYTPQRLAAIDGKNFHLANLPFNFAGYVWWPGFGFRPNFPYFYISNGNPHVYPGTKIDVAEPVLALPYTAPALCFLALAGVVFAVFRWPGARLPVGVAGVAVLPMTFALLAAIAISQRYTADFLPVLLVAAAFGLAAADLLAPVWRRTFRAGVTVLVAFSIFVSVATALEYQGNVTWGVPVDVKASYQSLCQTIDAFFGVTYHVR